MLRNIYSTKKSLVAIQYMISNNFSSAINRTLVTEKKSCHCPSLSHFFAAIADRRKEKKNTLPEITSVRIFSARISTRWFLRVERRGMTSLHVARKGASTTWRAITRNSGEGWETPLKPRGSNPTGKTAISVVCAALRFVKTVFQLSIFFSVFCLFCPMYIVS